MIRTRTLGLAAALAGSLLAGGLAMPAFAQDVSDTHLRAARQAVSAMRATREFDDVLPQGAQSLKSELIQNNPDLQAEIIRIVDETAIALAPRRADLEREAAMAYARVFSETELQEMADFYTSDTGQKLLDDSNIVAREIVQAAEIWQRGLARDLSQQVAEQMAARLDDPTLPEGVEVDGDGEAQSQ